MKKNLKKLLKDKSFQKELKRAEGKVYAKLRRNNLSEERAKKMLEEYKKDIKKSS